MSAKRPKIRFSLRLKLLLFGGFLAIVPAIAVGFGLMEVNASTLETQNREMRLSIADDIAETIESSLRDAHTALLSIQQILTNPEIEEGNRIEIAVALVEANPLLETVAIYGQSGDYITEIIKKDEVAFDREPIDVEIAKKASNETLVVGKLEVRSQGRASIEMTIALRPEEGKITGYLRARISLAQAQKRTAWIGSHQLSVRSRVDVLNSERRVILSSEPEEIGEQLPAVGLLASIETMIEKGVAQSGEDPARPVLVSARPLVSMPWLARVEVPIDEAYASLVRMRWIVGVGTAVAALLAFLMALFFASRITRPLKAVVAFTQRLGARAFDERVEVSSNDEIGLVARTLNAAAVELKAGEEKVAREIEIRADLGRYLPEDLVENVVRREQPMSLGGTRQPITVLFADVVRFTPLCENHSPEIVVTVLNELFTIITTIIFEHGGTVDKFIGDCVMAFWGAPRKDADQALHALEAAEQISRVIEFANRRWMKEFGIEIKLAMGLHTGEAIVGNVGSSTRMEYTAIGKAVNRAARLEALAHENQVLVSKELAAVVGERFDFRAASTELLSVGGEEIILYEVLF